MKKKAIVPTVEKKVTKKKVVKKVAKRSSKEEFLGIENPFQIFLPIIQQIFGIKPAGGQLDIGEILKVITGNIAGNVEVTPRSVYDQLNNAILDKKIISSPEAEAFLKKLKDDILAA